MKAVMDVHCHILPGVDDGSRSEEESLSMLSAAKGAGIDKMICTPHCKDDGYSQSAVDAAFRWFAPKAAATGIEARLGNELHWDVIARHGLESVSRHALGTAPFVLIEFAIGQDIGAYELRELWKICGSGMTPIIAHPERYICLQENRSLAYQLKNCGCLFQMSADVLGASRFSARRRLCRYLLKNNMYDFLASDAHRPDDYKLLLRASSGMHALMDEQGELLG